MIKVGISVAVASDIGPVINLAKQKQHQARIAAVVPRRRQSKSVDDVEMAEIHKSIEKEREQMKTMAINKLNNGQPARRRSKDDHDLPSKTSKIKDSHYYITEQKGFRKRFGKLFGSLRNRTHQQLKTEPETPSPSSEGEISEEKIVEKPNEELKIGKDITNDEKNNEVFNSGCDETTAAKDRE